jgi:cysteine desulfurase / selenocysteine lyase
MKHNLQAKRKFNVYEIRKEFPIFKEHPELVYLDNSATAQRPQSVIDRMTKFSCSENANIHRGVYKLGENATQLYDKARERLAAAINAKSASEIILTRGATEGFNLIAQTWGKKFIKAGDEILISELEHHSNVIPWMMLAEEKGAKVKFIPITPTGDLDLEAFEKLLTEKTKIVSVTCLSNVLGTVPPFDQIIKKAHGKGAIAILDGAQALVHLPIDVQKLDCDFFVTSGHKSYGPMGIGFVYGKLAILNDLPPYHGGGNMVQRVTKEGFTYRDVPDRFDVGTPNVCGAIAFAEAINYIFSFAWEDLIAHEKEILRFLVENLDTIPQVKIAGRPSHWRNIVSFTMRGVHTHDVAMMLSGDNIAVRGGFHCCQPLSQALGLPGGTVRFSLGIYNTLEDCERAIQSVQKVSKFFH